MLEFFAGVYTESPLVCTGLVMGKHQENKITACNFIIATPPQGRRNVTESLKNEASKLLPTNVKLNNFACQMKYVKQPRFYKQGIIIPLDIAMYYVLLLLCVLFAILRYLHTKKHLWVVRSKNNENNVVLSPHRNHIMYCKSRREVVSKGMHCFPQI